MTKEYKFKVNGDGSKNMKKFLKSDFAAYMATLTMAAGIGILLALGV